MNTAVINIRTDVKLKKAAIKVADGLGLSLSGVVKGFLTEFVKSKTVNFSMAEEPSEYLIKALKEADEERKRGEYYSFKDAKEAVGFLDDIIAGKK